MLYREKLGKFSTILYENIDFSQLAEILCTQISSDYFIGIRYILFSRILRYYFQCTDTFILYYPILSSCGNNATYLIYIRFTVLHTTDVATMYNQRFTPLVFNNGKNINEILYFLHFYYKIISTVSSFH